MSLEAILDPEGTQNKQKSTILGRQTPPNKTKRSRRPKDPKGPRDPRDPMDSKGPHGT